MRRLHRYVEWETNPDRKAIASQILKTKHFTPIPEFQFDPLPKTNPILIGHRWKEYHEALGLKNVVDFSWEMVQKEKSDMLHVLDFPYNGETKREHLMGDGKITKNEHHLHVPLLSHRLTGHLTNLYSIRNHGGVPDIDENAYELEIGGLVGKPCTISLKDLQDPAQFPQAEVTVTLQCSGTRRVEQIALYPGDGDELINAPWGEGAIGTAVYRGVPLKKVLKRACGGVLPECSHLEFIGADTYFKKGNVFNYAVSVPWRKVRANEEVLLAWEMNGQPLPKIHGAPLRVVVTGYIGARSCKWVYRINALPEPSMGPVQQQEYLYYNQQASSYAACDRRSIGKFNSLYSNGFSIQGMPVSSAIMYPVDRSVIVHEGKVELSGWAYSGNGNWPERVEVSPDGGHVWYAVQPDDLTQKHYHAWRLWKITIPVDAEGWLEFCVRTWDSSNNTEPTFVRSAWNWDLHVTSSSHRVRLYSVNKLRPLTAKRLAELEAHGQAIEPLTLPVGFSLESVEDYHEAMRKHPREPKD
ncbi:sulfite oxidase mitochondrial precursor [Punctularia strigosozonata HHB-11173 SS5]|uniref:sulfite oxidase mitochondrial precursor n=1 Tax=Punctularia strigosozonata (strain HHB-11173) TaxID=741275 RepID=UPI0004417AE3|nr:sulfite oxidase mitochondrial precursor [Punctularia strigosozonata HHB-11173 SS5]EIN13064.1 sulfite oxidase mitochondrial precursor [Punctularia strigosozonata HHB-11173 SS5]